MKKKCIYCEDPILKFLKYIKSIKGRKKEKYHKGCYEILIEERNKAVDIEQ